MQGASKDQGGREGNKNGWSTESSQHLLSILLVSSYMESFLYVAAYLIFSIPYDEGPAGLILQKRTLRLRSFNHWWDWPASLWGRLSNPRALLILPNPSFVLSHFLITTGLRSRLFYSCFIDDETNSEILSNLSNVAQLINKRKKKNEPKLIYLLNVSFPQKMGRS